VNVFIATLDPVAKPRMTKRDAWAKRPCVQRYWAFKDEIVRQAEEQGFTFPESHATIAFTIPMPKSWSKKKREQMNGQPHQQKPDLDNYVKAVFDSLLDEDCRVWHMSGVSKAWGEQGRISIFIGP